MGKTKKQLRAEAVERLKDVRYHTLADYVRAMLGWGHEPHFEDCRDALIDLLTDDCGPCYACAKLAELRAENSQLRVKCEKQAEVLDLQQDLLNELEAEPMVDKCADQAVDATRYALIDVIGATDAIKWSQEQLENANPALVNALKAHDSREKLESDALALVDNLRMYGCKYAGDAEVEIISMFDRQAAITSLEWCHSNEQLEIENTALQAKVDELMAENNELRVKCDEQAEVLDMQQDLLNEYEYEAAQSNVSEKPGELLSECFGVLSDENDRETPDFAEKSQKTAFQGLKIPPNADEDSRVITSHNELFEALEERERDSREKLEADVRKLLYDVWTEGWELGSRDAMGGKDRMCDALALLNRQAAITERERERHWLEIVGASANCNLELTNRIAELQARVNELERENTVLSDREFFLRCTLVDINGEVAE